MGRGRQKAKATRQAQEMKYFNPETDYSALERELSSAKKSKTSDSSQQNVHQGYAYIGLGAGAHEIVAAVANGAYAVLVEQRCEVIDSEVAFIKVDSLSAALMRLMRFEASYKNLKFCSVNFVQKALLSRMSLGKNVDGNAAGLLPEDATRLFIRIMKAGAGDLFFTDDLKKSPWPSQVDDQ